jgi:hypothetical protein
LGSSALRIENPIRNFYTKRLSGLQHSSATLKNHQQGESMVKRTTAEKLDYIVTKADRSIKGLRRIVGWAIVLLLIVLGLLIAGGRLYQISQ